MKMWYDKERYADASYVPFPIFSEEREREFWEMVQRGAPDECWPWLGSTKAHFGYGRLRINGRIERAHRVAYALTHKITIPPRAVFICHSCDNPPCCNPNHLWAGDARSNAEDCDRKGRRPRGEAVAAKLRGKFAGNNNPAHRHPECLRRGESASWSKLTEDDVHAIRARAPELGKHWSRQPGARAAVSLRSIAREYDVYWTVIAKVLRGETWRHVK